MIHVVDNDLPSEWLQAAIEARVVGADIETSGLDKLKDTIACIQFYVPNTGTIMVRWIDEIPVNIVRLMEDAAVAKVFQHAPFDLGFLMRDYAFMMPDQVLDTKIAAKLLDPKHELFIDPVTGRGSHSLIALVHHYFGYTLNKQLAVSNWFAETLEEDQLDYAAKDVEFLPGLLKNLIHDLMIKDPCLIVEFVSLCRDLPSNVRIESKITV